MTWIDHRYAADNVLAACTYGEETQLLPYATQRQPTQADYTRNCHPENTVPVDRLQAPTRVLTRFYSTADIFQMSTTAEKHATNNIPAEWTGNALTEEEAVAAVAALVLPPARTSTPPPEEPSPLEEPTGEQRPSTPRADVLPPAEAPTEMTATNQEQPGTSPPRPLARAPQPRSITPPRRARSF